jgi:hypothetical protein
MTRHRPARLIDIEQLVIGWPAATGGTAGSTCEIWPIPQRKTVDSAARASQAENVSIVSALSLAISLSDILWLAREY